jgi:hypothetical protein
MSPIDHLRHLNRRRLTDYRHATFTSARSSVLSLGEAMRRRDFVLAGGAAVVLPLAARAQAASKPVIGFMSARSPEDSVNVLGAFHKGLQEEGGFADGENVKVEYRWARGNICCYRL